MVRRMQRFDVLVTLGCLVLLSYFAWHAMKGPRGYDYLAQLRDKFPELGDAPDAKTVFLKLRELRNKW